MDCMQTIHAPIGTAPPTPQALDHADLESLKGLAFDASPVGMCVLVDGQPQLINTYLAKRLGCHEVALRSDPEALQGLASWLWDQLKDGADGYLQINGPTRLGPTFAGHAFARPLKAWGKGAMLVTIVENGDMQQVAFSSSWRVRMLEQAEAIGHSGSAQFHLENGRAQCSTGLYALLGLKPGNTPRNIFRMLRWIPRNERGYVLSIWRGALTDEPFEFRHRLLRKDGSRLEVLQRGMIEADATGRRHGYLILQDITAQHEAEKRIHELANHDEVTGLANRSQLLDRIDAAVHRAHWDPQPFMLISVQIDQIDHLKQAMGYGAGDAMAMAVASRLAALIEPGDVVARVDGGEFAILLAPESSALDLSGARHARAIVAAMARAERLGAAEIVPGARVGVARFPADAGTASQLLEAAQTARMNIDPLGDPIAFYTPETRATAVRRLAIESGLRRAAELGELGLDFQLQADLTDGEVVGAQVRLRWTSHALGAVKEQEFKPIALQTGLIVMLGDWLRDAVCQQLAHWERSGLKVPRMSLELSALELMQPDIVEKIEQSLAVHQTPPACLSIEISEQALLSDTQKLQHTLARLRSKGIELCLGEFGSGFTNLGLLRTLPIDVIKVHHSCVPDVTAATGDVSLTRAIINMAHSLQMQVLAEGVETVGQLTLLIANGCDRMQGPALAAATDKDGLEGLLATRIRLPDSVLARQRERTLLLVDDEPHIVSSLKRLFRKDGYRIVTAQSGAEGLQRMAEYDVDVVVSDQRMPGITGVEFLRRVKELYPDTIRMVLSGYTELQSITDAVNEGAIYRFLTKPWDDERLRQHVHEAFRQKEMADENKRLADQVLTANTALAQVNERLETVLATQQQQIDREAARANAARDVVDMLPVAVLGVAPDGTVAMINREAQRLWGPHVPLLGESASSVLPGVDLVQPSRLTPQPTPEPLIRLRGNEWRIHMRSMETTPPRGVLVALTAPASKAMP